MTLSKKNKIADTEKVYSDLPLNNGLFYFLSVKGANGVFLSICSAVLGGLLYASLVPLLMAAVDTVDPLMANFIADEKVYFMGFEVLHVKLMFAFLVICFSALLLRTFSQITLAKTITNATSSLRVYLCERIYKLPIESLEKIGPPRLISALTVDIPGLIAGASFIPILVVNLSVVLGTLAIVAVIDFDVFLIVLLVMLLGMSSYSVLMRIGQRRFAKARNEYDDIQKSIHGFIYGSKELKLSREKYKGYRNHSLEEIEQRYVRHQVKGGKIVYAAVQYGSVLGFLMIGVLVFGSANFYSLTTVALINIIVALIYMIGPLGVILNATVPIVQGRTSLNKLSALLEIMPQEQPSDMAPLPCNNMTLQDIIYDYPGEESFSVGPVGLRLTRGQITFLVGGNGSGKSTLAKVIATHYTPTCGGIYIDDVAVDENNLSAVRENISAIYTDFHLFTRLYGFAKKDLDKAQYYLKKLRLEDKVSLQGDELSTINLSDGQRKRLALLISYLEDRAIFVFDEWAADQDPEFREVFYRELLPDLKARNKIVVAVVHEDKYFDVADQLLRMESGKLQSINGKLSKELLYEHLSYGDNETTTEVL